MNIKMNIINKKVKDLIPYEKNTKKHDDKQIKNVAESIKKYGFVQPIVIDKDNVVIIGHCRLLAAKRLKITEVPCVCADDLTPEQVNALRIVDNKSNESEWDLDFLKDELLNIDLTDFDFDFGIDLDVLEEKEIIEDEVPDIDEIEPVAKLGDIWQLGQHRLMCGDSTSKESVNKLMNGKKADMVFTDHPYGVDYKGINNDSRKGLEELLDKVFSLYKEFSKNGASVYCFHSDKCADIFNNIFRKYCHFSSMIIWKKQSLVLSQTDYQSIHEPCMYGWFDNGTHNYYGNRKQTSVWEYERKSIEGHTTPKPIALCSRAIKSSSRENDIVLDLFGGSGSTLIACEQLNRVCYMMELDPKYCDVIIKRWETLTGKKAVLLND